MPFVLDASCAANWFMLDEEPSALAAWERMRRDPAIVPAHWWFETRNILLIGERRERLSRRQADQILDRLTRLRIELADLPKGEAVMECARRHNLTFYDAAYLELSRRERIPLATLDRELAAAAQTEGVTLVVAPP